MEAFCILSGVFASLICCTSSFDQISTRRIRQIMDHLKEDQETRRRCTTTDVHDPQPHKAHIVGQLYSGHEHQTGNLGPNAHKRSIPLRPDERCARCSIFSASILQMKRTRKAGSFPEVFCCRFSETGLLPGLALTSHQEHLFKSYMILQTVWSLSSVNVLL